MAQPSRCRSGERFRLYREGRIVVWRSFDLAPASGRLWWEALGLGACLWVWTTCPHTCPGSVKLQALAPGRPATTGNSSGRPPPSRQSRAFARARAAMHWQDLHLVVQSHALAHRGDRAGRPCPCVCLPPACLREFALPLAGTLPELLGGQVCSGWVVAAMSGQCSPRRVGSRAGLAALRCRTFSRAHLGAAENGAQ